MDPRVVILLGSPRKHGNSASLAYKMAEALKGGGIAFEEFYLHGRNIAPCSACESCQRSEAFACAVDDGMSEIYRAVIGCECLVLAAPIYNFTMSAQLKLFLDRS